MVENRPGDIEFGDKAQQEGQDPWGSIDWTVGFDTSEPREGFVAPPMLRWPPVASAYFPPGHPPLSKGLPEPTEYERELFDWLAETYRRKETEKRQLVEGEWTRVRAMWNVALELNITALFPPYGATPWTEKFSGPLENWVHLTLEILTRSYLRRMDLRIPKLHRALKAAESHLAKATKTLEGGTSGFRAIPCEEVGLTKPEKLQLERTRLECERLSLEVARASRECKALSAETGRWAGGKIHGSSDPDPEVVFALVHEAMFLRILPNREENKIREEIRTFWCRLALRMRGESATDAPALLKMRKKVSALSRDLDGVRGGKGKRRLEKKEGAQYDTIRAIRDRGVAIVETA